MEIKSIKMQRWGFHTFLFVLSLLFLNELVFAGPLGLPDSARPGAVRPQPEVQPEQPVVPAGDIVDIPAVIDRPFDIEEGPYVAVKEFRLLDAEDLPKYDVSIDEIKTTILEKLRQEQPERGFSIGELQEISDEVTRYYRAKGLILSTAVVPIQTVASGIVDIQIFIGRLGRVIAESNEKFSESVLRKPFMGLVGEPVTQEDIEAALLTLTDFPGLSVFGVFQPGQKVGEADLILKVQEEKWYDVAYRIDNHGTRETGRNRFRTTIDWNNPSGGADKVTASIQQTYNPKNSPFWSLDYERFLGRGFTVGLGVYKNRFDVGGEFASSLIAARTDNHSIYLDKSFIRSRQKNLSSRLSMTRKVSRTTTRSAPTDADRLAVLAIEFNYDSVDTFHPFRIFLDKINPEGFGGGLNFATLSIDRGFNNIFGAMGSAGDALNLPTGSQPSRRGGNADATFAAGQFAKLSGSYQRLQLMTKNQSVLFKSEFQYSPDILVPLEQYSVGGPENVRGFPEAQGLFDRAYFFSIEYIFNAPFIADVPAFKNRTWGELLQFSVFYDFAVASKNAPLQNTEQTEADGWINYKSVGMGLRFNMPGQIDSRLMYATELGSDQPGDERHRQIWGDFTYSF
jgi:hemolysin activation/secretion protein